MQINTEELRAKVKERYVADLAAIARLERYSLSESWGGVVSDVPDGVIVKPQASMLAKIRPRHPPGSDKSNGGVIGTQQSNKAKTARMSRQECIDALKKMDEPYLAQSFAGATGISYEKASQTLCRLAELELLKRVGVGKYVGTASFRTAAANPVIASNGDVVAGRMRILGLDREPDPESLSDYQAKLEKTLRERDDANANGRDKIARILNDKIAMLERKIASLK